MAAGFFETSKPNFSLFSELMAFGKFYTRFARFSLSPSAIIRQSFKNIRKVPISEVRQKQEVFDTLLLLFFEKPRNLSPPDNAEKLEIIGPQLRCDAEMTLPLFEWYTNLVCFCNTNNCIKEI